MNVKSEDLKDKFQEMIEMYAHKEVSDKITKEKYTLSALQYRPTGNDQFTIYVNTNPINEKDYTEGEKKDSLPLSYVIRRYELLNT